MRWFGPYLARVRRLGVPLFVMIQVTAVAWAVLIVTALVR